MRGAPRPPGPTAILPPFWGGGKWGVRLRQNEKAPGIALPAAPGLCRGQDSGSSRSRCLRRAGKRRCSGTQPVLCKMWGVVGPPSPALLRVSSSTALARSDRLPRPGAPGAGAAAAGCGRAALPVRLAAAPAVQQNQNWDQGIFILFSANSFLDSRINLEKVAFSSCPLKSLNFPSASTHILKCSFPAGKKKPKQNQTRIPGGMGGKQQTETNQTNKQTSKSRRRNMILVRLVSWS